MEETQEVEQHHLLAPVGRAAAPPLEVMKVEPLLWTKSK